MENKLTLRSILTLVGLVAAGISAYFFAQLFKNPSLSALEPVFSTYYGKATPIPFPSSEPKITATVPGRIHSFAVSPDRKTIAWRPQKASYCMILDRSNTFVL